jgi:hypothetical protein
VMCGCLLMMSGAAAPSSVGPGRPCETVSARSGMKQCPCSGSPILIGDWVKGDLVSLWYFVFVTYCYLIPFSGVRSHEVRPS